MNITDRVLDLIPWLAGALALLWAAMASSVAVQWFREFSGKSNQFRYGRGGAVPQVTTGNADGKTGGVR